MYLPSKKGFTFFAIGCALVLITYASTVSNRIERPSSPAGTNNNPAIVRDTSADAAQRKAVADRQNLELGKKLAAANAAFAKSPAGKVCAKHPQWTRDICATVAARKIHIGMTDEKVRASWGRPERINRSVYSFGVHEQWIYHNEYLYFEDGVLTSYQLSR